MKMALWQGSTMNAVEYKSYHEAYMADNEGTTSVHVFLCIFFTVQCLLLYAINCWNDITLEYVTIVLPAILAHTVLADHILALNVLMFVSIICKLYFKGEHVDSIRNSLRKKNLFHTKHIQSVSCLRGLGYLVTVFAILAVDFKVFRKDLRKTEKYGYSLMGTGVGMFAFMSGLVHKNLRNYSLKEIFKSNGKFSMVLVFLGIARFCTVNALHYQQHVTEYGVHWNFFFTIAICKLTSTLLLYISNRPSLFSALTLILHEYLLASRVETWVFSDVPRSDLLSANREGISSCLGYTSIYLFAAHVKQLLNDVSLPRYNVLMKLIFGCAFLWVVSESLNTFRPISRTLANSAYCTYVCSVMLAVLSVLYFFEATLETFKTPVILTAINQNGLIYFLIANLFTGSINLSIQTLFVPDIYAILILNCYMITTLAIMIQLMYKNIKI